VKTLVAGLLVGAALALLSAVSSPAGAAQDAPRHVFDLVPHFTHSSRLAPANRTSTASGFNCVSTCSSYESTINQYFTDVAADNGLTTNVYSVATQYSSIQYDETFAGSYVETHPFPTANGCQDNFDKYCVTDSQLQQEIGNVIERNGWPKFSLTTLYFIFTPANVGVCFLSGQPSKTNDCTTNRFCAYHTWNGGSFFYAVEPDAAQIFGCDPGEEPAGNHADATINTISHEQNEAITDPIQNGWRANDGPSQTPGDEMADLCQRDFGTPLGTTPNGESYNQVINGHDYYLQLEYSNSDGGCVPYLGGPVTAASQGSGPLVYENGTVMTSNAVYAIYWVPTAPANRALPTISGRAKVGKKLTASHGGWSNAPKFTYRWLRCSSVGTSCTGISKATASSYTLVKADAHHRIEVRVTATNMAGHARATSAPTSTVKS
jgi:hypothetical protein